MGRLEAALMFGRSSRLVFVPTAVNACEPHLPIIFVPVGLYASFLC